MTAPGASNLSSQKSPKYANLLACHREDALSSWKRLLAAPASTAMTITVIAVALLLPSFLLVVNSNLGAVVSSFRDTARITVYLETSTSQARGEEVSSNLRQRQEIAEVQYISRQQALEDFSSRTGLESLLADFSDNPLPATIILTPVDTDLVRISALADELAALPEVSQVQLDAQWIRRADALADALGILARGLGLIFLLGVCFIIGNTIKMGVEQRQAEIRVIKLVGGSHGFIARPFLYTGLYLGSLGGLLALVLLLSLLLAVQPPLQGFAPGFNLQGPSPGAAALLIFGGALAGWISALLASRHHIRLIDP